MKKTFFLLSVFFFFSAPTWAEQPKGNPEAGKQKATLCFSCHGQNGIAVLPIYPNLAGQNREYLDIAVKAYREGGERSKNPIMPAMIKPLSDVDMADIVAYFSGLKK